MSFFPGCMTTSSGFLRRGSLVALACFIVVLDAITLTGEEPKPSAVQARADDEKLRDAIQKVRTLLKLEESKWELKGFHSKNDHFTVVHDLHRLPSLTIMRGDHVALVDSVGKVLWAKRTRFHWPIIVGEEGTVALPQWEERDKSRPHESPSAKDGLNVKLFDTTGRELASSPLGRFLDTNALIQPWVLEERTLFVGGFSPGDKRFYFTTRARSKRGGHPLYAEIYCLQRDGELIWRYPLKEIVPYLTYASDHRVTVIGEPESDGQRQYLQFYPGSFRICLTTNIPVGYKVPANKAILPAENTDN